MVILTVCQFVVLINLSGGLYVTPLTQTDENISQYYVPSHQIPQNSHRPVEVVKSLPMFYGLPKFEQFRYENSQEEVYSRRERNEIFPYSVSTTPAAGRAGDYRPAYTTASPQYTPVTPAPSPQPRYTPSPYYQVSTARSYYQHPVTPTPPPTFQYSPSYYGPNHHITPLPERREENPHLQQNLVYTDNFFQSHPAPGYSKDYSNYVINNYYGENYQASVGKTDPIHLPVMTNSVEVSPFYNYQQRELKPVRQEKEHLNQIHRVPIKPAISFIDPPKPHVVLPQPLRHPVTPTVASAPKVSQVVSKKPPSHPTASRPLVLSPQSSSQPLTPRPLVLSPQSSSQSVNPRPLVLSARPQTPRPAPKLPARHQPTFQDTRQSDPHQRQQQHQQPARTSVIARQPKSLRTSRLQTGNSLISARVKEGSRSAALLRLMEIAGDDWSKSEEEEDRRLSSSGRSVKFTCPESEGHFPAEDSCSVYYQCAQGTPHRRQCDTGLYWSVDTDMCDWRENVTCHRDRR